MTISAVTQVRNQPLQFRGLAKNIIEYEAVWDPASVNSNSFVQEDVTVPGVAFGDMVLISAAADLQNLNLFAHVKSADTISVHLNNNTAVAVNLGAVDLHIIVLQLYHQH